MMRRDAIRIMGFLSLGLAAILLILCLLNLRSWLLYGQHRWWPPLLLGSAYWGVLGVGMVYFRKWAAAVFAISMTSFGLYLSVMSVMSFMKSRFPGVLVNVPLGLLLCVSLVPVVRFWRELK